MIVIEIKFLNTFLQNIDFRLDTSYVFVYYYEMSERIAFDYQFILSTTLNLDCDLVSEACTQKLLLPLSPPAHICVFSSNLKRIFDPGVPNLSIHWFEVIGILATWRRLALTLLESNLLSVLKFGFLMVLPHPVTFEYWFLWLHNYINTDLDEM